MKVVMSLCRTTKNAVLTDLETNLACCQGFINMRQATETNYFKTFYPWCHFCEFKSLLKSRIKVIIVTWLFKFLNHLSCPAREVLNLKNVRKNYKKIF